jgi:hypothetical protein
VHKINLLRMVSFDRALGGRSTMKKEPLVAEAWSRRNGMTADERAVLAAVLASEGDRLAVSDRHQASNFWRAGESLLPSDQSSTWTLIHRARLARRLGQPADEKSDIPLNAFAGVFTQGAGR